MTRDRISPYIPREDSVAGRVLRFFDAHPDEHLSTMDIAKKFDMDVDSVPGCLREALNAGHLVRRKDLGPRSSLWARGPRRDELLQAVHTLQRKAIQDIEAAAAFGPHDVPAGALRVQWDGLCIDALPDGAVTIATTSGRVDLSPSMVNMMTTLLPIVLEPQP